MKRAKKATKTQFSDLPRLDKKQDRKRARAMEEELAWIRKGVRGRQTKSKARISAYDKLVEEREAARLRAAAG